jgi:hypothetical protein
MTDNDQSPEVPRVARPWWARRGRVVGVAVAVGVAVLVLVVVWTMAANDDGGHGDDDRAAGEENGPVREPGDGTFEPTSPDSDETGATTTNPTEAPTTAGDGSFGEGLWLVGRDIAPGRYMAADITAAGCDWARLSDTAGQSVIAAEADVGNQAIVDILASDAAFRSTGCGQWGLYAPPDPPLATTIEPGDWVVGEQIQAGVYRTDRTESCLWTRASGFEHTDAEVIQTESSAVSLEGPYLAQVAAGSRFTTRGCATWTRTD